MKLESLEFKEGEEIPQECGNFNGNQMPSFKISDVPKDAKSLLLYICDPDTKPIVNKIWTHLTMWNIPIDTTEISKENIPDGAIMGQNSFEEIGYGGMAPPTGKHNYIFQLLALDRELGLSEGSTIEEITKDISDGCVISKTELKATYESTN